MPLSFSGRTSETESRISIQAADGNGNPVVVMASYEAFQDYGIARVEEAASRKFDAGLFEENHSIFVRTQDCQ